MRETESILNFRAVKEGGAWAVAAFLLFTLYKILTNDLTHLNASIENLGRIQEESSRAQVEALNNVTKVIEVNTEILRQVNR